MLNILKLLSDFRIARAISLLRKLEHVSNVYRRSTEENHGTTFVFHYTIRDNVESQNMRLLEQDDVLQRDLRQITESTETIFPFLKVSNSYYHTPTYILNLLFSVKKKNKTKLKTTLALHTYLTLIPLYITDFF